MAATREHTAPPLELPSRERSRASRFARASDGAVSLVRTYPLVTVAIAAGLTARLLFWLLTDRKFEDGLITIAHARNVVEGIGLTHHAGEPPTHGFTSALSVLVPLVGEFVGQAFDVVDGFAFVRLASLVAFVAAAIFAVRIAEDLGLGRWPTFFVVMYLAVGQNQIFYGMSGMETQLAVAVLLAGTHFVMRRRYVAAGVSLGLALLARPDFLLWAGLALPALLLWDRRQGIRAGLVGAAIVTPWVAFTVLYYGSPVPNTVRAKALRYPTELPSLGDPSTWVPYLREKVDVGTHFWRMFTPLLENGFVVATPLPHFAEVSIAYTFMVLALIGAVSTLRAPGWWVALAFLGLFTVYRFVFLPAGYYEWYYVPFMALTAVAAGAGIAAVSRSARRTGILLAVGMAAMFAAHLPVSLQLERTVQKEIENRVRLPMGEWLGANVAPGERVTSESAGYVGYYGRVLLWDYPGLTSKQAVAVMEQLGPERNSLYELIAAAQPEWIVLRPFEHERLQVRFPRITARYVPVSRFWVSAEDTSLSLAGVSMYSIDRDFTVFRRADVRRR